MDENEFYDVSSMLQASNKIQSLFYKPKTLTSNEYYQKNQNNDSRIFSENNNKTQFGSLFSKIKHIETKTPIKFRQLKKQRKNKKMLPNIKRNKHIKWNPCSKIPPKNRFILQDVSKKYNNIPTIKPKKKFINGYDDDTKMNGNNLPKYLKLKELNQMNHTKKRIEMRRLFKYNEQKKEIKEKELRRKELLLRKNKIPIPNAPQNYYNEWYSRWKLLYYHRLTCIRQLKKLSVSLNIYLSSLKVNKIGIIIRQISFTVLNFNKDMVILFDKLRSITYKLVAQILNANIQMKFNHIKCIKFEETINIIIYALLHDLKWIKELPMFMAYFNLPPIKYNPFLLLRTYGVDGINNVKYDKKNLKELSKARDELNKKRIIFGNNGINCMDINESNYNSYEKWIINYYTDKQLSKILTKYQKRCLFKSNK